MATNASVKYNDGFLSDIILLALCYEDLLSVQPIMFLPKRFDASLPVWGILKGFS